MSRKIQGSRRFIKNKTWGQSLRPWVYGLVVMIGIFYGSLFLWPVVPSNPNGADLTVYKVKIKPQSGLASISGQLYEQGISTHSIAFQISATALLVRSKLKPGTYLFPTGASLGTILLQIARGDRVKESIAIVPGMTVRQLRQLVDAHPSILHQTKGMSSKQILEKLNLTYPGLEGIFMPDTYISQAWSQKEANSPLKTPYELLILASIVEKETGRSSERSFVAAVFTNRLNKGMMLQTDPTVIYGIGPKFDGNLRKADLRKDNPYNTYMRKGLPPTPIAMPSKDSIQAAIHPAASKVLFFVAKGDGSSYFSQSLGEHERAVNQYQRKPSRPSH